MPTAFSKIRVGEGFNMKAFHTEMQRQRQGQGKDVTLKSFLQETYGAEYSPEKFYSELGIDLKTMTVDKMLNTSDLSRWLFPEVFRDAIRTGVEYTPFFKRLITGEETISGTGLTMPKLEAPDADDVRLRDTREGANITLGRMKIWKEKQVNIKKKARGLEQTYESLAFTPINLATIYFEELGQRLGADLDRDLIDILINGDQVDGSEAAPVIGAATANTLTYLDIARAWIRFKRINRNSTAMIVTEADALTLLNMEQFQKVNPSPGASQSGVTLNVQTPLPTNQDIYVHDAQPAKKITFVDPARAVVQLTAWPLLIESERIVNKQLNGQYVSIMTGFANVFKNGRMVLDYATDLTTNPGPVADS